MGRSGIDDDPGVRLIAHAKEPLYHHETDHAGFLNSAYSAMGF